MPEVMEALRRGLKPFALNFLFGPRQVGKSTALKLLVKELIESGRDPRSIFYCQCDMISDHRELFQTLRNIAELKERWGVDNAVVILDEATYPREWYRALKYAVDVGMFRNDVIYVSGSVSMYAKREVETFPGRRGHGVDVVMHPLSFGKFAELLGIPRDADPAAWRDRLMKAMEIYLQCGGFPRAVVNCFTQGEPGEEPVRTLLSAFSFDLAKLRRNETYVK